MSKNDDRILALQEQVKAKREAIGEKILFIPKTNCSLELDGVRYNLHVMQPNDIVLALSKLYALRDAAASRGMDDCLIVSNYHIDLWIADLEQKRAVAKQAESMSELIRLEEKLATMLSDDKKLELELDEIENLLK